MDTDASVGCAIACATDLSRSVFKDINDKDDEIVGCAIAHAADPLRSNAKVINDKDDESFVELKSDGGGEGLVLVGNAKEEKNIQQPHCQKHPIIYFIYLIS